MPAPLPFMSFPATKSRWIPIDALTFFLCLPYNRLQYQERNSPMRIWFKIFKDNHLLKDTVIEDNSVETRTHKIFKALDAVCYEFDLGKPIWLDATVAEFKRHDKARFYQDNFVEEIPFDYLEIHVIEED